jgi:hypothetical protein
MQDNGGVLFNTLQSDVAQKERENINLKMEIAHLRVRFVTDISLMNRCI